MQAKPVQNGTVPEVALLSPEAPRNVFEMYCALIEGRLDREIKAMSLWETTPYRPSPWGKLRGAIKRRLLSRWRAALVPDTCTVVRHDPQGQDFIHYILRQRPDLPLDFFPASDHALLRHFVINKLLYAGVRVFETTDLYPEPYASARVEFTARVTSQANRPVAGEYETFGFRTREPFGELADFGALARHYGLDEFADQVPDGGVLDIGPFIGDSTFAFAQRLPGRRILCLEPDPVNRRELMQNLELNGLQHVEVIPKGAASAPARLPVVWPGTAGCSIQRLASAEHFIEVDTVDRLVASSGLERVGLIKMDIEGCEASALQGAAATIRRDRPMIIAAAYHRGADIFEIPRWLRDQVPGYQFRFRHLDPRFACSEYVIFALPPAEGESTSDRQPAVLSFTK